MINGRIPDSELAVIPGGKLVRPYAMRWNLMVAACRAAGAPVPMPNGPASSYRTVAQQIVLRNYWCSQGRCANAAIPGTSNHGWGRAVDTNQRGTAWRYGTQFGVRPPTDAPWESWHCLVHLDPVALPKRNLEPTLRRGVINRPAVAHLQRMLRADGMKAPLTAAYDVATRRAVRRFQVAHHLGADGVVGPKTWRALHRAVDH